MFLTIFYLKHQSKHSEKTIKQYTLSESSKNRSGNDFFYIYILCKNHFFYLIQEKLTDVKKGIFMRDLKDSLFVNLRTEQM